jgi:GGDEF domain-containing protein
VTGLATLPTLLAHARRSLARVRRQTDDPTTVSIVTTELDALADERYSEHDRLDMLQEVAERLRSVTRPGDLVSRIAECGFAVLFEDLHSFDEAVRIAERVIHVLDQPLVVGDNILLLQAQLGVAFPDDTDGAEHLLHRALEAMHAARANPGQRYDLIVGSADPPRPMFPDIVNGGGSNHT